MLAVFQVGKQHPSKSHQQYQPLANTQKVNDDDSELSYWKSNVSNNGYPFTGPGPGKLSLVCAYRDFSKVIESGRESGTLITGTTAAQVVLPKNVWDIIEVVKTDNTVVF